MLTSDTGDFAWRGCLLGAWSPHEAWVPQCGAGAFETIFFWVQQPATFEAYYDGSGICCGCLFTFVVIAGPMRNDCSPFFAVSLYFYIAVPSTVSQPATARPFLSLRFGAMLSASGLAGDGNDFFEHVPCRPFLSLRW